MSLSQNSNAIKVKGVITVRQYGEQEFRWVRTPHAGSISFRSSEVFTDEWSAWLTAVQVAPAFECMVQAPADVRERIIAHQGGESVYA